MAKKPDAARGKTTRKGKIKKIIKNVIARQELVGAPRNMSPGAMGGRTKLTPEPRRQKIGSKISEASKTSRAGLKKLFTPKAAGAAGAGMAGQAMKLAKQLKMTGRLSVADLMRAKRMLMKRKGK